MAEFILGLILGGLFGMFIMCICFAAKDEEER